MDFVSLEKWKNLDKQHQYALIFSILGLLSSSVWNVLSDVSDGVIRILTIVNSGPALVFYVVLIFFLFQWAFDGQRIAWIIPIVFGFYRLLGLPMTFVIIWEGISLTGNFAAYLPTFMHIFIDSIFVVLMIYFNYKAKTHPRTTE